MKEYEIIVGVNSRNIISPKEVDIPIIITKGKTIFKIAIEVNGSHVHKNDDYEKMSLLNGNIIESGISEKLSFKLIKEQIELFGNIIKKDITNCT